MAIEPSLYRQIRSAKPRTDSERALVGRLCARLLGIGALLSARPAERESRRLRREALSIASQLALRQHTPAVINPASHPDPIPTPNPEP